MSGLADTTLVLYRSVLPDGEPTAVSGLIFMPHGRPPRGGWKLISWAHGTSGIADVCALSREQASFAPYSLLARWLASGYAITQTDYQGLGTPGTHLYLVGRAEAASVVHIALAARQLYPGIGRRFAIAGLSQGGQAALFAAAEAKRDAPSLKLVGVEALAPSSHIAEQFKAAAALTTPGGETTALGGMILVSAAADSPAVQLNALLTPQALALVPAVGQECLTQLAQPDSWGGLAPADLLRPGADTTALYQVLDAMNPALAIHAPVLLLQGEADTTVLPAVTNALDAQLNALGDSVEYDTFPGVTHIGIINAGAADATSWLAQRFADLPRHK
jgi:pimeloyl-ACP methyl ester carboxylesterase